MPLTVDRLVETLKDNVGDPSIRVVRTKQQHQILCREADEDLVQMLTARYAPGERFEVVGL